MYAYPNYQLQYYDPSKQRSLSTKNKSYQKSRQQVYKVFMQSPVNSTVIKNHAELFDTINKSEIKQDSFYGPFGQRKIVYCDYTATARPLEFIEEFIKNKVLPLYANTHTLLTETANQTTLFREEAREIIKKSVNGTENDVVLFTGSGSTAAIHKMVRVLNFKEPPIVFVSPYEHHSNLLIWRETTKYVIEIHEDANGNIDLNDLENKLKYYSGEVRYANKRLVGSFSAASNVTGIMTDVDSVAMLMHKYNGLAFFDYATAAPYLKIDMNAIAKHSEDGHLAYKDAVFISTHKMIGGPQTPGILIAKSKLFQNEVPDGCGGGTVFLATEQMHEYVEHIEEREEGGTPAIVESIRAGLVFQLKEDCNVDNITKKEHHYAQKAINYLKKIKNLKILGNTKVQRLPIFSFIIENEQTGFYLHPNFVTALLNDLFGVQTRSGCACAGPYTQKLLNISNHLAGNFIKCIKNGTLKNKDTRNNAIFKPGFTRLSFTFFMNEETIDYILECVKFVADYGWMFLPFYEFDVESGVWRYKKQFFKKEYERLTSISYSRTSSSTKEFETTKIINLFKVYFAAAFLTLQQITNALYMVHPDEFAINDVKFTEDAERLLWFMLPSAAYRTLYQLAYPSTHNRSYRREPPFKPKQYTTNNNN